MKSLHIQLLLFFLLLQSNGFAQQNQMTGKAGPGLEEFDSIVQGVLDQYQIPGAGLAIAKNGKLVLARGYGMANLQAGDPVQPTTGFLLASVSKSFTAAAILNLVQHGKLTVDQKAFDILTGIEPVPGTRVDPRTKDITVSELLHHEGGWDRQTSGDPMTYQERVARTLRLNGPMTPRELVRYMLGQRLDFTPGTKAVYSNYGYMLLGMIVERISGEDYAKYVQQNVLHPMGITGARDSSGHSEYFPDEARRYGPQKQVGPGGTPSVHFASGGWIASAVDMARFLTTIDGSRSPRLLNAQTTQLMLAAPNIPLRQNGTHFGMGWDVVQTTDAGVNYWKNGGLMGTTTWIEHRANGADWVLLLNANIGKADGPELHQQYCDEIRTAIDQMKNWPDMDLFSEFQ
jgi:CubicO group peptidase (beta-lactamase class C family)